jgi:hypothetical protein
MIKIWRNEMAEELEEAPQPDWHGRVDWTRFISTPSGGCTPSGVDLILVGSGSLKQRMGELLVVALTLVDRTDRAVYPNIRLVQPVGLDAEDTVNLDDVSEAAQRIRGTPLGVEERLAVTERVEFIRASALTIDAFEAVLRASLDRTFVAVTHCARYRGDPIPSKLPAAAIRFEEDLWVPHLLALAERALDVVEETLSAVLLDAGLPYPHRPENFEQLKSVPGAVLGATMKDDPSCAVILSADGWVAKSRQGQSRSACAEIDVRYQGQVHMPCCKKPRVCGASCSRQRGCVSVADASQVMTRQPSRTQTRTRPFGGNPARCR